MRHSPYVPCGYTQAEVAQAARDLPKPSRAYAHSRYRVAVREPVYAYNDRCGQCCNSTTYCRYLEFEVNSALDYRTDRIVYWWTLVGGS